MDSETRSKMKKFIETAQKTPADDFDIEVEIFVDFVYDLAYRKGWCAGYWRIEPDYAYQTNRMKRKK